MTTLGAGGKQEWMADLWAAEQVEWDRIDGMHQPARCAHCRGVYDLGTVEVAARYADCSVWKAPCCGRTVDDRGETGWKARGDYARIGKPSR